MSMFKKAVQEQIKIRMAIYGPSGSGKTYSALNMAKHLGQSVAVIDTEHGSSNRYARYFDFDVCELDDPELGDYIRAVEAAERAGYDTIIIDSMSHAWYRELEMAGGNFNNWKNVRPLERKLIESILAAKCHTIVTMRSKTDYVKQENAKGKSEMVKVGTAAIQSADIIYEFDIVGVLTPEHIMNIEKSRCMELTGKDFLNPGQKVAEIMLAWAGGQDVSDMVFASAKNKNSSLQSTPKGRPQTETTAASKTVKKTEIWDNWKSRTDAVNWALTLIPDADPEFLMKHNETMPKDPDKNVRGKNWVNAINDFKKFGGYQKLTVESSQEQIDEKVEEDYPTPPKSEENIWDSWNTMEDALAWASSILTDADPEFLSDSFKQIPQENRGKIWVETINYYHQSGEYVKLEF